MDEVKKITRILQKTFEKNAWHGPSVREVVSTISGEDSSKRLPNTHSINELVQHMTSWRIFVLRKLQGDDTYIVTEELNFPLSKVWSSVVEELERSQVQLLDALQSFPLERLSEKVPHGEHNYTFYTLLHGIVHHDLYHLGQIMLIHKATK
jgi:uncharacterized damage-inducible protein DinB